MTLILLSCLRNEACSGGKDLLAFVEGWRVRGEERPKFKLRSGGPSPRGQDQVHKCSVC